MTARTEIETRLIAWAKAQTPPIPVASQNASFNKPASGPYLEIFFLGDSRVSSSLAADGVRRYGMFQINCYAPVNKGMGTVESLAEAISNLYPVLPKTGTVSIESPLNWSSSFVEDGYVCIPVRANYRIET